MALRLKGTHTEGDYSAKVYKDNDWNEHRVKFYHKGKHLGEGPDYHTDDPEDAHSTAKIQLKRYNTVEKHLEDHERAHTGNPNSKIDHGQGKAGFSKGQRDLLAGKVDTDPVYQRLRNSLDKGLD